MTTAAAVLRTIVPGTQTDERAPRMWGPFFLTWMTSDSERSDQEPHRDLPSVPLGGR
jgi:hypothetical protein